MAMDRQKGIETGYVVFLRETKLRGEWAGKLETEWKSLKRKYWKDPGYWKPDDWKKETHLPLPLDHQELQEKQEKYRSLVLSHFKDPDKAEIFLDEARKTALQGYEKFKTERTSEEIAKLEKKCVESSLRVKYMHGIDKYQAVEGPDNHAVVISVQDMATLGLNPKEVDEKLEKLNKQVEKRYPEFEMSEKKKTREMMLGYHDGPKENNSGVKDPLSKIIEKENKVEERKGEKDRLNKGKGKKGKEL